MTTTHLVKDILNSIIQAQYESYQHSKRIGEQDFKLLPIPYAEIAEITLDLKYAYADDPVDQDTYEELDLVDVYTQLQPFFEKTLTRILQQLVELVDDHTHTEDQEWQQIRDNLLDGKLNAYILGDFKSRFINNLAKRIKKNNLTDYYQITESLLSELLIQSLEAKLIVHDDFSDHAEKLNERMIKEVFKEVHAEFERHKSFLQHTFNSCVVQKNKEAGIIIDSDILAKMPAESVQRVQLKMHLKNMIRETNNENA